MCTAAELEIERSFKTADCNDSYDLSVLLAEDCRSAELLSVLDCKDLCLNRKSLKNNIVYHLFDLSNLFGCHCLGVIEVESQTVIAYIGTCLLNMVT